jgi:hypothetical protein
MRGFGRRWRVGMGVALGRRRWQRVASFELIDLIGHLIAGRYIALSSVNFL